MSFPRYERYKESGVEWLGEVPVGWEVKRLKYLCDVQTGDKDTVNAVEGGDYPFFVRSQTVERINSFAFDCEAVLTAGDGVGVGKVYHHYIGKFDFHQRVYMMNNFRLVTGKFFFCYLAAMFHKVALEGGAKSTVDSLRMPLFTNFEFALPPLSEQNTIAAFLDRETGKIDELVVEQERLIDLLKEKRQATISHSVTKGLNPDAPMKDSGIEWLGEVPVGWVSGRLAYVSEMIVDGTHHSPESYQEGKYLYVTAKNIKEGGFDFSDISYLTEQDHKGIYGRCPVKKNDVLYIKDGATAGVAMVNDLDEEFSLLSSVALLRPDSKLLLPDFLSYQLNASQFKSDVLAKLLGGAMTRFTLDTISRFIVVIPPTEEQSAITAFLNSETIKIYTLVGEARQAISLLKERRSALISAAVTGKIDVRHAC